MSEDTKKGASRSFWLSSLGRWLCAPISLYSRYMLRSYFLHTFLVTFVLLSVILTIELSPWAKSILVEGPTIEAGLRRLARFAIFRATDIASDLLFIACFLGVLWSEISLTGQGERTPILNSGRSPMQCLVPVIIFTVPVGLFQFVLDSNLRPVAVMQMAAENLGNYGAQFERNGITQRRWLAAGNDTIEARIQYNPPMFLDMMIYQRTSSGDLAAIVAARWAVPTAEKGVWSLCDGSQWQFGQTRGPDDSYRNLSSVRFHANQKDFDFGCGEFKLKIDPLWLRFLDTEPRYIDQLNLGALANASSDLFSTNTYKTEVQARYARAFTPTALSVLATSLSLLLLSSRVRLGAIIVIALTGYMIGSVLVKVLLIMGAAGDVPPFVAAWFAVLLLLLISAAAVGKEYGASSREPGTIPALKT